MKKALMGIGVAMLLAACGTTTNTNTTNATAQTPQTTQAPRIEVKTDGT